MCPAVLLKPLEAPYPGSDLDFLASRGCLTSILISGSHSHFESKDTGVCQPFLDTICWLSIVYKSVFSLVVVHFPDMTFSVG